MNNFPTPADFEPATPYEQGRESYQVDCSANPYEEGTQAYDEWENGYNEAREEARENGQDTDEDE